MLDVDTRTYLPDDLLTKIDIATMAYSLEGRSPLLDHEFMQFAASLPERLQARTGARTRSRSAPRCAAGCRTRFSTRRSEDSGCRCTTGSGNELHSYARDVLLDRVERWSGACSRRTYVERLIEDHAQRHRGQLPRDLDAADVRALAPRGRQTHRRLPALASR